MGVEGNLFILPVAFLYFLNFHPPNSTGGFIAFIASPVFADALRAPHVRALLSAVYRLAAGAIMAHIFY